jgi:hypothetical protein
MGGKMKFSTKIKTLSVVMIIAAVFAMSFLPTATIYGKDKKANPPATSTEKKGGGGQFTPNATVRW